LRAKAALASNQDVLEKSGGGVITADENFLGAYGCVCGRDWQTTRIAIETHGARNRKRSGEPLGFKPTLKVVDEIGLIGTAQGLDDLHQLLVRTRTSRRPATRAQERGMPARPRQRLALPGERRRRAGLPGRR
jgi:hypothetical protein